jgi:hypothetical protein
VKVRTRPEHDSMLQANDWLAEFRDGRRAEPAGREDAAPAGPGSAEPAGPGPAGPGYAVPASYSHAVPASSGRGEPAGYVRAVPADPGYAVPANPGRPGPAAGRARPQAPTEPAGPAAPAAPARTATLALPAGPASPAAPASPAGAPARAVIGDQLRMPIMWCEMGSCISWHADPAALGEADARARALAAGWRIDAVGRLACPRCQQDDPGFWASRPVVPWDRYTALARTARIPSPPGYGIVRRDFGRAASGFPPANPGELEWHHDSPVGQAMPAGRYAGNPAGTSHSRGTLLNPVRAWRARGRRQAAIAMPADTART